MVAKRYTASCAGKALAAHLTLGSASLHLPLSLGFYLGRSWITSLETRTELRSAGAEIVLRALGPPTCHCSAPWSPAFCAPAAPSSFAASMSPLAHVPGRLGLRPRLLAATSLPPGLPSDLTSSSRVPCWLYFVTSQALRSHCFDCRPRLPFGGNGPRNLRWGQLATYLLHSKAAHPILGIHGMYVLQSPWEHWISQQ